MGSSVKLRTLLRGVALAFVSLVIAATLLSGPPASALIFASPENEPTDERPTDFPNWEHVTQRRYQGPTVIYLGSGHAMTARHVGMGEIIIGGEIVAPVSGSKRTLLNANGSPADAMIFKLKEVPSLDAYPTLPIARTPLQPGEDILIIGFGKNREKVVELERDGRQEYAFTWSKKGRKRWGTNRVESRSEFLAQDPFRTRAVSFDFDRPFSPRSTRFEAQAAIGDSGGAVFVKRDGAWLLGGMMISVSGRARKPQASSTYGDSTHAVDLSHYRDQVLRWTRPDCANERDDDGDNQTDFPNDPDCDSAADQSERDAGSLGGPQLLIALSATFAIVTVLAIAIGIHLSRQRGTRTPNSTSPSSAA